MFENGFILLDKPYGLSSNRALQQLRKNLNYCKAGYAGTLDPMATGMLPICLGKSTKCVDHILKFTKTYLFSLQFGITTNTGDMEGEIIQKAEVSSFNLGMIEEYFQKNIGHVQQKVPMFSAVKYQGQPLYKLARQKIVVDLPARKVYIQSIKIIAFKNPILTCQMVCGSGVYVRQLVSDVGEYMGYGATTTMIRRLSFSVFDSYNMQTLSTLMESDNIASYLIPREFLC